MTEQPLTRWQKFKRFLKRSLTPTWAAHFSYQVFAFIVSVAMVVGVAEYAVTKTYDERKLVIVDGFTITANMGAFGVSAPLDFVNAAIENEVQVIELDIRQRPDGTIVLSHDIVVTNNDGVPLGEAFELIKPTSVGINLNIKEMRTLNGLYQLLVEYNLVDRCFMTGIEVRQAQTVKESDCKDIPFYVNYMPSRTKVFMDDYRQKLLDMLAETGAIGINCYFQYAGTTLSELLHQNGYKLSVWTVDSERIVKKMLMASPDNIITKDVNMVENLISDWGK